MTIFKAYDIRGIYNKDFSEKEAYLIAYYLIKHLKLKEIKIGKDIRLSSNILTKFFIQGAIKANAKIIYLGLISTPNFYYSLFDKNNSGVMITASHNPKEYNGFKIMYNGNSFDSRNGLLEIEKLVIEDNDKISKFFENEKEEIKNINFDKYLNNNIKYNNILIDKNITKNYVNFLEKIFHNLISNEDIKILKKIKFSIDFSSGVSSIAIKGLLNKLKLNPILYNDKPDGNFPNHSPDPLKAINYLKNKNDKTKFSCAFDGDGDRIIFFDENKDLIMSDYIIAKYIDYFSNNEENDSNKNFVVDLRISKIIKELEKKNNLSIKYIRVGRAFYKNAMEKTNAIFGAELSGHLFFKEFNSLDNPDIALIHMLKIILNDIKKKYDYKNAILNFNFKNMFEEYKIYFKSPELNIKVRDPNSIISRFENEFKEFIVNKEDGLSFDMKNWWFNIRKSNTEALIRINLEGIDKNNVEIGLNKINKIINN